jgi:CheY-like chemotaxis protein
MLHAVGFRQCHDKYAGVVPVLPGLCMGQGKRSCPPVFVHPGIVAHESLIPTGMSHLSALVVDEDSAVGETLRSALERLGCSVSVVATTEEARAELGRTHYDAVFAELCARGDGSGGRGIARWLKSQCSDTACFVVTGWKGELESGMLRGDGICGVISKPLIFNEIRDEVVKCLG